MPRNGTDKRIQSTPEAQASAFKSSFSAWGRRGKIPASISRAPEIESRAALGPRRCASRPRPPVSGAGGRAPPVKEVSGDGWTDRGEISDTLGPIRPFQRLKL